jgi:hypothetical protein
MPRSIGALVEPGSPLPLLWRDHSSDATSAQIASELSAAVPLVFSYPIRTNPWPSSARCGGRSGAARSHYWSIRSCRSIRCDHPALFTGVRGIGILRSSHTRSSEKFVPRRSGCLAYIWPLASLLECCSRVPHDARCKELASARVLERKGGRDTLWQQRMRFARPRNASTRP